MRREDKLALLLGLVLGPGMSLTTMALPQVCPNAPFWLWLTLFWGGLTISISSIIFLIYDFIIRPRLAKEVKLIPLTMIICGFVLIICAVIYHIVDKSPTYTKEKHFSVSLTHAFTGPQFAYKSTNEHLYFLDVLLRIDLVNKANVYSKIIDYYSQILCDDKWITLQRPEFTNEGQFYFVSDLANKKGTLIEFDQRTIDEQIKYTNLEPGKTITGILIFYLNKSDRYKYDINKATKIKLVIYDSLRNKEEYIIDLHRQNQKNENQVGLGWLDALAMKIIKKDVDLKSFEIMNDY